MRAAGNVPAECGQTANTAPDEQQPQLSPSISSAAASTGGVFRFWMDFSAAALRAALKAFIAIVSCRPVTCSTRVARHTPSRTDIKSPRVTGDTPRLERDERDGGGGTSVNGLACAPFVAASGLLANQFSSDFSP